MEEIRIQIKRVRPSSAEITLPVYMTEGSAGMDLSADIDGELRLAPMERALIPTGIAIALPQGLEGSNSSAQRLSSKTGINDG